MNTKYEIEDVPMGRGMPPMRRIKLTPKGKRWADVIRKELKNPESVISNAVRDLKAWHHLSKINKKVRLELSGFGGIQVACYGHWYGRHDADRTDICALTDVGYLFP